MSDAAFLYMAECKDGTEKYFKVGITRNAPRARMAQLQTGSPHPIECSTFVILPSWDAAVEIEALTHTALDEFRACGEWFCCDAETIGYHMCQAIYRARRKLGIKTPAHLQEFWRTNVFSGAAQ